MVNNNNCASCKQIVKRSAPGLQCAGDCRKYFHATCGNVTKDVLSSVSSQTIDWFCSSCKNKKRQSIVVLDSTPLATPTTPHIESNSLNNFMLSIKADINEFKKQQSEMLSAITFISNSYDDINLKLANLDKQCEKMDAIALENTTLKKLLYEQSVRITSLEQAPLMNCVEINGIPDHNDIQPTEAVATISKAIDFDFDANDIEYCRRTRYAPKNKPKNIIVCFKDQMKKDTFISAKKNKSISTTLFIQHQQGTSSNSNIGTKIFINEMLCPANKKLLFETKAFARNNGFKFVWVRDGLIYIRKTENQKFYCVRDVADLSKIVSVTTRETIN